MTTIDPHPRGAAPFDTSGTFRDEQGVAHYAGLPSSLVEMFRATVRDHPGQEALVEVDGERLTYQQLWDRAARVAGGLRAAGVERGDRVANLLPAGVGWVLGFLGTQLAGAVAVPVNIRFAQPEIDYVLSDSGAKTVLRPESPLPDGEPYAAGDLQIDELVAIFYTSGTTGFPKGAMTTHENFLSNVETVLRVHGIDRAEGPRQRNLISVPLFHVTGCNTQLLVQIALGGTTVVLPAFHVRPFLRTIVDERINVLTSVPAIYALALSQPDFADFDVRAVTRVGYGGSPIAPSLVERIKAAFPQARVGNGFGLTETSSIATYLPHEWATEHTDSVGFAAPVVDLALHEPDSAGVGELLIRGPNVVAGYWNKPEATGRTFAGSWLHSGDLARIDEDGLVHVVDRAKDMINRGGENVYSVEVENALASAPGVADAAVVGVPDEVLGEKVGAVVVAASEDERLSVPAVLDHLAASLADFKIPQYVDVRTEPLPRNPGGKLLKRQLREQTAWGAPVRGR